MIKFPQCLERFFKDCLAIINRELGSLGLTTLEVVGTFANLFASEDLLASHACS